MFRTFAAAGVLALTVTAAQAADVAVYFGDLSLTDPHDARVLADRLEAAAETSCAAQRPDTYESRMYYQSFYDQCVRDASRAAAEKVRISAAKALRAKIAKN